MPKDGLITRTERRPAMSKRILKQLAGAAAVAVMTVSLLALAATTTEARRRVVHRSYHRHYQVHQVHHVRRSTFRAGYIAPVPVRVVPRYHTHQGYGCSYHSGYYWHPRYGTHYHGSVGVHIVF